MTPWSSWRTLRSTGSLLDLTCTQSLVIQSPSDRARQRCRRRHPHFSAGAAAAASVSTTVARAASISSWAVWIRPWAQLAGTSAAGIPEKEYRRKYGEYDRELYDINEDIEKVQNARDLYVEELELLSKLGGRLADIFRNSGAEKKRTIVKVLASNASLKDGKARLNLFSTFEVLSRRGDDPKWWRRRESNPRPEWMRAKRLRA